jgi:hypothetical protein
MMHDRSTLLTTGSCRWRAAVSAVYAHRIHHPSVANILPSSGATPCTTRLPHVLSDERLMANEFVVPDG